MTQPILAFRTDELLEVYPEIKTRNLKRDYLPLRVEALSAISLIKERSLIENNPEYIHPIPYIVVRNSRGEYYSYQRCKGIGEERLLGAHSIGFGGHMDEVAVIYDENNRIDFGLSLSSGALRELFEEIDLDQADIVKAYYQAMGRGELDFGVIYTPVDEVGSRHLGIVMIIRLDDVETLEDELEHVGYLSLEELLSDECYNKFEPWSQFVLDLIDQWDHDDTTEEVES